MFGTFLKLAGQFLQKVGESIQEDIIDLVDEVKVKQYRRADGKLVKVIALGYYCAKAKMNCDWYGKRCSKCCHQGGKSHAVNAI